MEEKEIRKYLRRSFRPLGWSLTAYYAIMNIMVMMTVAVDSARLGLESLSGGKLPDQEALMEASLQNAWGYLVTIAVGLCILLAWKGWDFFREEVFERNRRMALPIFLMLSCVFLGCQVSVSLYASVLEAIMNCFGLSAMMALEAATMEQNSVSMFLYASLGAPIAEELIFRGFIQRTLQPFGKKFAIFGAALLFGMFHGNLVQTPYAFLVGLVLGYTAAEYSIWWAIALHMLNNMVMADLLPRLLGLLPSMAGDMILGGILWAFAIAAVVILIVKRQEVKAYIRGECMDPRCVRGFFLNSGFVAMTVLMIVSMLMMVTPV